MRRIHINLFSGCLLVALVLVGIVMLALMFLRGGVWLGEQALPYFLWLAGIALGVVVIVLLPMAAFHQTQRLAAKGLLYASAIFGITLWVQGLVLTYNLWGGGAVLVGLFFVGVGVVPMAMLAALLAEMWSALGQLLLLAMLTYGTRHFGKRLAVNLRRVDQKIYEAEIVG
jgi:hypothetical protein